MPVTIEVMDEFFDSQRRYLLFVEAKHQLNAACTANCEMGATYEDGGCSDLMVWNFDGTVTCTPGGGPFWWPADGVARPPDGGVLKSAPRMVAPGAEMAVFFFPDNPQCPPKAFTVPAMSLTIGASRNTYGDVCTFTAR